MSADALAFVSQAQIALATIVVAVALLWAGWVQRRLAHNKAKPKELMQDFRYLHARAALKSSIQSQQKRYVVGPRVVIMTMAVNTAVSHCWGLINWLNAESLDHGLA